MGSLPVLSGPARARQLELGYAAARPHQTHPPAASLAPPASGPPAPSGSSPPCPSTAPERTADEGGSAEGGSAGGGGSAAGGSAVPLLYRCGNLVLTLSFHSV